MLFPRWADFSPKTPARVSRSFCGNLLEARCAAKQPRTTLRNSVLVRFDTTLARISVLAQIPKSKGGAGLRARPVQIHNDASPHPRYVHPDPKCNGLDPIRIQKTSGIAGTHSRPVQSDAKTGGSPKPKVGRDSVPARLRSTMMQAPIRVIFTQAYTTGSVFARVPKSKGGAGLRARPARGSNKKAFRPRSRPQNQRWGGTPCPPGSDPQRCKPHPRYVR